MTTTSSPRRLFRVSVLVLALSLAAPFAARAQETLTPLSKISVSTTTEAKPQSKLWFHANHWWAVLPTTSVSPAGTWVWRLDGTTWQAVLRIASSTSSRADAKSFGDVVHVLLFDGSATQLVSIEYAPSLDTYMPWSSRGTPTPLSLSGSETATIDVDSTERLWLSTENGSHVRVYYSDFPYSAFQGPVTIADNIAADDITMVVALPLPLPSKVGVFWSNQNTQRFGFRTHVDGDPPGTWSADEVPASQSALQIGGGMADDHMNAAVGSDGTLYASIKTSYNTSNVVLIGLLVRRTNGTWDDLYTVELGGGTRPLVVLNELLGFIRVVYTADSGGGPIYYRDSPFAPIAFGARKTAINANLNNATSTKDNWTDQLVVIASGSGVLFREGAVATTSTSSTTSTSRTTTSTSSTSTTATSSSTSTTTPGATSSTSSSSSTSSITSTTSTSATTTTLGTTGTSTFQAGVSGPAGSASVDTNIRLSTPTRNWGTDANLYVGVTNATDNVYRTIMAFDLSSIPAGATVTSCKLTVNVTQRTNPTPGHVRRLCAEHWLDGDGQSEAQATWQVWKTGAGWGLAGAGSTAACGVGGGDYTVANEVPYTPPAGTGAFTFPELKQLCQDALAQPDRRLRLRISQDAEATQSNLLKFDSSDATTADRKSTRLNSSH